MQIVDSPSCLPSVANALLALDKLPHKIFGQGWSRSSHIYENQCFVSECTVWAWEAQLVGNHAMDSTVEGHGLPRLFGRCAQVTTFHARMTAALHSTKVAKPGGC